MESFHIYDCNGKTIKTKYIFANLATLYMEYLVLFLKHKLYDKSSPYRTLRAQIKSDLKIQELLNVAPCWCFFILSVNNKVTNIYKILSPCMDMK